MALKSRLEAARDDYRSLPLPDVSPSMETHHPRRGRQILASAAAILLTVLGISWWIRADEPSLVQTDPATGASKSDDADMLGAIAEYSPDVKLSPAGPYSDGQVITLSVPAGFILPEGAAMDVLSGGVRQCAVLADAPDGPGEWCDPADPTVLDSATPTSVEVSPSRLVFTPMGYRDCEDPEVTCRLVLRADGGAAGYDAASAPLRFGGEIPSRRASIEWVGEGSPGSSTLTPDGVEAHPSWIEMRSSQPERAAEIAPFWVLICAFGEPEPPEDPWGANPWGTAEAEHWVPSNECDYFNEAATIAPEHSEAPIRAAVPTWFMGSHGWVDCRTDHCFVQMGRAWVKGARVGGEVVASAVISPDLVDPAKDRPALRVVTPGPHAGGQDVTVAVTGLNPGILSNIALCRSGNEWDCGDVGPLDRIDNGTHLVHLPENFKCSPRCYLELRSPGEGFPALATAPIDVGG